MVKEEVGPDDVADVVSAWTGIPAGRLLEGETGKLLRMESELGRRLVGQAQAVQAVSDAVRRSRAGIADPDRPSGSFLFLGPTGVGKTELAKALAEFLFDDERAIIRIDMSEYSERHSVARLVGAPPGYVGYEEGGQLTEAVRRRPYCVVLLDEVEKAHPEVFDILLQVLDDGRLTDGQGRTVDFRNTILILTSNLGSQFIADPNLAESAKRDAVMSVVQSTFKPEFLNRLDDIILFDALSTDELTEIVDLQVARLGRRLSDRRLTLTVTPAAREWLALTGFDPVYGARPLRRLIQSAIGDQLARGLLAGEIADGDTVVVDLDEKTDKLSVGSDRQPAARPRWRANPKPELLLVEQVVVAILGQAEVIADPVAQAEQQPQLRLVVTGLACRRRLGVRRRPGLRRGRAAQAQLHARRRPLQRALEVAALHQELGDQVAHPGVLRALGLEPGDQGLSLGLPGRAGTGRGRVARAGPRKPARRPSSPGGNHQRRRPGRRPADTARPPAGRPRTGASRPSPSPSQPAGSSAQRPTHGRRSARRQTRSHRTAHGSVHPPSYGTQPWLRCNANKPGVMDS